MTFNYLKSLSKSTLNNFLKKNMKMSLKKRYKLEPKMTKEMKVCNLHEWAVLLETLVEKGVEFIYFDEFMNFTRHFACSSLSK